MDGSDINLKVAIFCEAGTNRGMGHLVRSYTVYKEFLRYNINATFFLDSDIDYTDRFADIHYFKWNDFKLYHHYDIIFMDSYEADITIYNYISINCKKAIYIDDYKRINYPQGTIINFAPNAKELYKYDKTHHNYLLGLKYIPIKEELQHNQAQKKRQIFIMLGGSDIKNLSFDILDSLKELSIKKVVVINNKDNLGKFKYYKDIEILYKPDNKTLSKQMVSSLMAITTASMSVYELTYLKIPTVIIAISTNQLAGVKEFLNNNLASYYIDITQNNWKGEMLKKVQYLLSNNIKIVNTIDGNGAKRVVQEVMSL